MNFDPGRLVQSVILISLSQGVHLDQVDELKTVILYLNYFVLNLKKNGGMVICMYMCNILTDGHIHVDGQISRWMDGRTT